MKNLVKAFVEDDDIARAAAPRARGEDHPPRVRGRAARAHRLVAEARAPARRPLPAGRSRPARRGRVLPRHRQDPRALRRPERRVHGRGPARRPPRNDRAVDPRQGAPRRRPAQSRAPRRPPGRSRTTAGSSSARRRLPMTLEALLTHYIDELDSRVNSWLNLMATDGGSRRWTTRRQRRTSSRSGAASCHRAGREEGPARGAHRRPVIYVPREGGRAAHGRPAEAEAARRRRSAGPSLARLRKREAKQAEGAAAGARGTARRGARGEAGARRPRRPGPTAGRASTAAVRASTAARAASATRSGLHRPAAPGRQGPASAARETGANAQPVRGARREARGHRKAGGAAARRRRLPPLRPGGRSEQAPATPPEVPRPSRSPREGT